MATAGLEKRALVVSIFGGAFMACLGVYFAIAAESDAIMLDGVFSGIGFLMASLTLKVAGLVKRPDDEHFHYGYSHFAPQAARLLHRRQTAIQDQSVRTFRHSRRSHANRTASMLP